MKNKCWLLFGLMVSTSLLAQQATSPAPTAPITTPAAAPAATLTPAAPKTNAPAAKTAKKSAPKKKAAKAPEKKAAPKKRSASAELKTVPLVAGPAEVVASNVNVRAQAKLTSEVVAKVTKGDTVTVIEEVVNNHSGPLEPSAWAKIELPGKARAWVNTSFLDAGNQTVKPKKLNLRSGPGENYSVIGTLKAGEKVKALSTKGDWTEIEPPTGAHAFMAAQYLKQAGPSSPVTTPPPPEPPVVAAAGQTNAASATPPTPATVATAPTVAPPPTEPPAVPPTTETPVVTTPPPVIEDKYEPEPPPPPRIVQHEGIVRGLTSIQAPSRFVLVSPQDGRDINYLHTDSTNLDLRRYKGLRIVATGEEGLDERWPNVPVLTIQRIQVVQ